MYVPASSWARWQVGLWSTAAALMALAAACCATDWPTATVDAAPHVVAPRQHPYDPDWPEVSIILANKCVGCHRPNSERVDLSSYEAVIAADDMVVPGDPEASLLWEYVNWNVDCRPGADEPDEPMMPPERHEWLAAGQLETIRRWIERGGLQYKLPNTCNTRPLMEHDFPSARVCAQCHPKQYEEWAVSMHAYGQQSPVFEGFNLALQERTSGTIDTFCTRCHTPVGTALGEDGHRRNVNRSQLSLEGVTCVACHRRKDGRYKSNGRVRVEPGAALDACIYGPFDGAVSQAHGGHPSVQQPYMKSSQFCGECHDVTSPQGVRLEEAFSEWQNSPAAAQGITCQQCHMGPVQGVPIADDNRPLGPAAVVPGVDPSQMPLRRLSDHTFAGPDYSLLPDTEFPHKLDWMFETDYRDPSCLTPHQAATLRDLRHRNRRALDVADAKRYELLRNAARISVRHPSQAAAGSRVHIAVDVKSLISGHSLPTGFTAERQVWVQIEVRDPQGRLLFVSGDLDHNGDLRDEHSRAVLSGVASADTHLLNFQNKFIALSHKGTERSVVLSVNRDLAPINILRPAVGVSASFGRPPGFRIAKGSLPPLATRGQRYPVSLGRCEGLCRVIVKLNFRHLPPTLLDHVGTPHLKPQLEVVELCRYEGFIEVGDSGHIRQFPLAPRAASRPDAPSQSPFHRLLSPPPVAAP